MVIALSLGTATNSLCRLRLNHHNSDRSLRLTVAIDGHSPFVRQGYVEVVSVKTLAFESYDSVCRRFSRQHVDEPKVFAFHHRSLVNGTVSDQIPNTVDRGQSG